LGKKNLNDFKEEISELVDQVLIKLILDIPLQSLFYLLIIIGICKHCHLYGKLYQEPEVGPKKENRRNSQKKCAQG